MVFNSYSFLIFFPIVVLIHFIIPKKIRYIWLLVCSYYFYMNWDARYVLLLLFSTIITYLSGIAIEKVRKDSKDNDNKKDKIFVAISFMLNIGILFFFKYFDFTINTINLLLSNINMTIPKPEWNILLPVGISFYIFQSLSYTVDVYRNDIRAEKNFLKYALFVSFFPQLVAGPIERSKNLLKQVKDEHSFSFENMREGLLIMLWGYFLKLVLADRIAIVVDTVYGNHLEYQGMYVLVATFLFAIQIYCDFAGYSIIAVGAAKILGFELMENFNCPYFSQTISEFWRRWHISLSSWFRDYLYIPLGGNRKGACRKYLNLIIVFCVSGVWHGAAYTYVIWGLLHGVFQVIGDITKPIRDKIDKWFDLRPETLGYKIICGLFTFILVDFTWIFFRANSLQQAIEIIKSIVNMNNFNILWNGALYDLGISSRNFYIMFFGIMVLVFADFIKYKGIKIREIIIQQALWCRWICYIVSIMFVLIFGVWGGTYDASNFIYFQF